MAVAKTLEKYLAEQGIKYEVVAHPLALSASRTAQASHVSGECIAKAVVLKGKDVYRLAVLPATHHIQFNVLRNKFKLRVELAKEEEVSTLFTDCEIGAIPPIGAAYGLDVIADENLAGQRDIYFEGGDHTSLVRVTGEQFDRLMADAQRGRFSEHD
ncbi:MAG: aminoacyl-tRNA deacylase [Nitrospinota bacterium]